MQNTAENYTQSFVTTKASLSATFSPHVSDFLKYAFGFVLGRKIPQSGQLNFWRNFSVSGPTVECVGKQRRQRLDKRWELKFPDHRHWRCCHCATVLPLQVQRTFSQEKGDTSTSHYQFSSFTVRFCRFFPPNYQG